MALCGFHVPRHITRPLARRRLRALAYGNPPSAGSQVAGTTCGKSRAKLTISRLDEIFHAGFLSVKGCKVDILTMFGAQFALMVQDRSLKRGEAPVWGVVSSDTNLHPRPALLFV